MLDLLEKVPELEPVYRDHRGFYDEVLPHVLLAGVTDYVCTEVRADKLGPGSPTARIARYLEDLLESDSEELQEMVCVSFAENLIGESDVARRLIDGIVGPCLRKEIADRQ